MITEDEYNQIQFMLGRKGAARPKTHKFPFTGIVRCGYCGAMVTAEEKYKKQKNGKVHHYIYYHCTKKKDRNCLQRSLEIKEFNKQVDNLLQQITIPEKFKDWAIQYLHELKTLEAQSNEQALTNKHRQLENTVKQLDTLALKFISPENADGQLYTNQEYQVLKSRLLKEKAALEDELKNKGREIEEWVEASEKVFNFVCYARLWFNEGTLEKKRYVFSSLGSNFILQNQELLISLQKPFKRVFEALPKAQTELKRLEPLKKLENKRDFALLRKKFPVLSG